MSKTIKTMIDPDDAVMLLLDHQSGLMESYDKAQNVQKVGRETKLDRLEAVTAKG